MTQKIESRKATLNSRDDRRVYARKRIKLHHNLIQIHFTEVKS